MRLSGNVFPNHRFLGIKSPIKKRKRERERERRDRCRIVHFSHVNDDSNQRGQDRATWNFIHRIVSSTCMYAFLHESFMKSPSKAAEAKRRDRLAGVVFKNECCNRSMTNGQNDHVFISNTKITFAIRSKYRRDLPRWRSRPRFFRDAIVSRSKRNRFALLDFHNRSPAASSPAGFAPNQGHHVISLDRLRNGSTVTVRPARWWSALAVVGNHCLNLQTT